MTDRYVALTVALERTIREDDAQPIIEAIKQLRGVLDVVPVVADAASWAAYTKAKADIGEKLWRALNGGDDERA